MPAKLQYEALEGILIIHNFGFFWQSEINLSVLWWRGYSGALLVVFALKVLCLAEFFIG